MGHRFAVVIIQRVHIEERKIGSYGAHCRPHLLLETLLAGALTAHGESDTAPHSLSWIAVDLKRQDWPIHCNRRFLIDTVLVNVSHNTDNLSPLFHLANLLAQCILRTGPVQA